MTWTTLFYFSSIVGCIILLLELWDMGKEARQ
jgi:hypothetical protein